MIFLCYNITLLDDNEDEKLESIIVNFMPRYRFDEVFREHATIWITDDDGNYLFFLSYCLIGTL